MLMQNQKPTEACSGSATFWFWGYNALPACMIMLMLLDLGTKYLKLLTVLQELQSNAYRKRGIA